MEAPTRGYMRRCVNNVCASSTMLAPSKLYASVPTHFMTNSEPKPLSEGDSNFDIKGTPLFELLSVRVVNRTFKEHLKIFGHIRLIDEHGNEFSLFYRKRSQPKTVCLHDTIESTSIILENFDLQMPRCLPSKFWLKFYLKDKHQNIVIVDHYKFIDCTRKVTYDKELSFSFKSWPVCVDYARFRCALLAKVSIFIESTVKDGSGFLPAQVSGRITATTEMSDGTCIKRLLYDGSEALVFGALHDLSILAVPIYSLLELQADVWVDGENVKASLKFKPDDWFTSPYKGEIPGKTCRILVFVHWEHASECLPEYPIYEYCDATRLSMGKFLPELTNKKRPRGRNLKRDQLCYIQPHLEEALDNIKWRVSKSSVALMEVFSISLCCYCCAGRLSGLKGEILASDNFEEFVIFNKDDRSSVLDSHDTVKLKGPRRCYNGDYFSIDLDLKDGQGHEISSGAATFDFTTIDCFYNRRICSIVRGKHGFSALHYTIFEDAVQAKLSFKLKGSPFLKGALDTHFDVHGRINTRYTNFKYSSHYAKKYYQSTLLENGEVVDVDIAADGEIKLSQSVVAVPLNASLIVLAKLHVLFQSDQHEILQYEHTFDPEKPETDEFQGSDFSLHVSVEWTRLS